MFSLFWPQVHLRHVDPGSTSVAMGSASRPGGSVTARMTVVTVPTSCLPPAVSALSFQRHIDGTTTRSNQFFSFVCAIFFKPQWQRLAGRPSSAAATASTDVCQRRGTATARPTVRMELTREAVVN